MFREGIVAEALAVRAQAPSAPALSGLGYAEALAFADGVATYQEAIASAILRTRAYAKRQQTWFRRMQRVFEIDAADGDAAATAITAIAREKLLAA
jgi:tRNA dimethylallyltransferase